MLRTLGCISAACLIAACTSAPVVYDPKDLPGAEPSGSVRPLKDLMPVVGGKVWLVFVHGVGDHCSGYALNRESGWLRTEVLQRIGMEPASEVQKPQFINVSVFMGGDDDARSGVGYSTATYSLRAPGLNRAVPVQAVEITWSPLTQWVKSNQLGYDSPSTTPAPGATPKDCTQAPDKGIALTKEPPSRLLLDRIIKEQIFDRNLSDAILYSGSYGATMERGVAEALCHAVTGTPAATRCTWPANPKSIGETDKFFFVTHSLGSRVIYDVFLNLFGYSTDAKPNPFTDDEIAQAEPAITRMLASTQALYMMANQLSLLGLANVPKDARSGSIQQPYFLPLSKMPDAKNKSPAAKAAAEGAPARFGNVVEALSIARSQAKAQSRDNDTSTFAAERGTLGLIPLALRRKRGWRPQDWVPLQYKTANCATDRHRELWEQTRERLLSDGLEQVLAIDRFSTS